MANSTPELVLYLCGHQSFLALSEELVPNDEDRKPFERICSLMRKAGALWLLRHSNVHLEEYFKAKYPAVDEECARIKAAYPKAQLSVVQLTFFGSDVKWPPRRGRVYKANRRKATAARNEILGTAVLIQIDSRKLGKRAFVFEALIALPSTKYRGKRTPLLNNYIHVASLATITVAGHQFEIEASYYSHQNGFSAVCAHSCLKMALWHLKTQFQPSTHRINEIAAATLKASGDKGKFNPQYGLNQKQIEAVCDEFDACLLDFDCAKNAHISPYEMAYLLQESGIPTILVFPPTPLDKEIRHMVPVIGHTMNTDEWFPFAIRHYTDIPLAALNTREHNYISSAEWAPHLIIHDDLLGPYFCIGPNTLTRKATLGEVEFGRASQVFGIFPKKLGNKLLPIAAQEAGRFYFWNLWDRCLGGLPLEWTTRLRRRWGPASTTKLRDVVLRTQIIRRVDYIAHLEKMVDHDGRRCKISSLTKVELEETLPEFFWLIEFSLPEVFCANRAKLGEIALPLAVSSKPDLFQIDAKGQEAPYPLLFRMMGRLYTYPTEGETRHELYMLSHAKLFLRKPAMSEW